MSMTFTKLFSSITESTIWCEDSDTRVVWITFLAMADRRGRVFGAIPGIANRARVSVSVAETAINKFLGPDQYSRSNTYDPASEGRRLVIIEGGWKIINHEHYRSIRDEEERKIYKADHERERRAKKRGQNGQAWTGVDRNGHNAEAEEEADADADKSKEPSPTPSTQNENRQSIDGQVHEIASLHPKILDAFHLSHEVATAIADAIVRDGRDPVWAGTKSMADAAAKWPKEEMQFLPSAPRYFRESQYRKDPREWERAPKPGKKPKTIGPNPADIHLKQIEELNA
jgi:hypothetical protein